jgi:hypothetical protein
MQPVLIDRGKLVTQAVIEVVDDFGVALHDEHELRTVGCRTGLRCCFSSRGTVAQDGDSEKKISIVTL